MLESISTYCYVIFSTQNDFKNNKYDQIIYLKNEDIFSGDLLVNFLNLHQTLNKHLSTKIDVISTSKLSNTNNIDLIDNKLNKFNQLSFNQTNCTLCILSDNNYTFMNIADSIN
jgi:hypothetical protein